MPIDLSGAIPRGTTMAGIRRALAVLSDNAARNGSLLQSSTRKFCRLSNTVETSLSAATPDLLEWSAEDFDDPNWHESGTFPRRITVDEDGLYWIEFSIGIVTLTADSYLTAKVRLNNTTYLLSNTLRQNSGTNPTVKASGMYQLSAGDYLEAEAECGIAATILDTSADRTFFSVAWLGKT
jgi:hypothetical protein